MIEQPIHFKISIKSVFVLRLYALYTHVHMCIYAVICMSIYTYAYNVRKMYIYLCTYLYTHMSVCVCVCYIYISIFFQIKKT